MHTRILVSNYHGTCPQRNMSGHVCGTNTHTTDVCMHFASSRYNEYNQMLKVMSTNMYLYMQV